MITLTDNAGTPRANIHVDADGGVTVGILDGSGVLRLLYLLDADGNAVILPHDADGVAIVEPAGPTNTPSLN